MIERPLDGLDRAGSEQRQRGQPELLGGEQRDAGMDDAVAQTINESTHSAGGARIAVRHLRLRGGHVQRHHDAPRLRPHRCDARLGRLRELDRRRLDGLDARIDELVDLDRLGRVGRLGGIGRFATDGTQSGEDAGGELHGDGG
jgi:hypothetical protein